MIEIVSALPLNTIQDLGRFGARRYGISASGAMDPLALKAANILLGNHEGAAAIEVQLFPFSARFLKETAFAVTGADTEAMLDDAPLPPWWTVSASSGQTLTLNPPRRGARAYLALAGGVDVPLVFKSRSTHLRSGFGGFEGRALKAGDVVKTLPAGRAQGRGFGLVPPDAVIRRPAAVRGKAMALRVIRAGDYDLFPRDMQDLFWQTDWRISNQSDRGGYRLAGAALQLPAPVELRSYGLVAGIVQVPPSGEPIIQLSDANTAGGYPKIAAVIDADLWRLAQARPGSLISFIEISHAEAAAAMQPVEAYLAAIRRGVELRRAC